MGVSGGFPRTLSCMMRACFCYFVVAAVIDLLHALELSSNMHVRCDSNNSVALVDHLSSAVRHACTMLTIVAECAVH